MLSSIPWPGIHEPRGKRFSARPEEFDVVAIGRVKRIDEQNAVIEALARLLKVVGRVRKLLIIIEELKSHPRRYGEVEPLVEIFFRHVIGLLRRLGLGLVQFAVVDLIQDRKSTRLNSSH